MMNNILLAQQLESLGLNQKEAKVYLVLLQKGILTPLEISRETNINRTTVYRLLENLKTVGLVEEIIDQYVKKARAADPKRLHLFVARKEVEFKKIKSLVPDLINNLSELKNINPPGTKVAYFRDQSGLQQMLWNTLKSPTKSTVAGYGYLDWNAYLGQKFAEKLRQEYVEKKIYSKEISNKMYHGFTNNKVYLEKIYQNRVIPSSKLEINHNTYIYNDVFCFYGKYGEELYGIEVHNPEITKAQRQIFYLLWNQAKKI